MSIRADDQAGHWLQGDENFERVALEVNYVPEDDCIEVWIADQEPYSGRNLCAVPVRAILEAIAERRAPALGQNERGHDGR